MSRATYTYLGFALALVAGLWLVLHLGGGVQAPPAIGGVWPGAEPAAEGVEVAQSGRFVRVVAGGAEAEGQIVEVVPAAEGGWERLRLSDGTIIERDPAGARFTIPGRPAVVAHAPSAGDSRGGGHAASHPLLTLLLQVSLILVVSRAVGLAFTRLGQPQVMGEMVAGIVLGPSLFGAVAPGLAAATFPAESIPNLYILSQVGVVFFLFLIGLELDPRLLRNRGHAALVISHASIIAPFLLGAALALYLYPRLFQDTSTMRFTAVALFMGAAMSITAFPVLARILTERNLHKSKVGAIAITCAAVDDVTAWCMLAFVVGVARAEGIASGVATAVLSLAYVLVMFFAVRPLLRRLQVLHDLQGRLSQSVVAVIVLLVLVSAYATEWIGIHALFGAFLMGAIMPKGTQFVRTLSEKLEDYTVVFLLPIFFAYTGLKTQIGLIDNAELWLTTLLIVAVACAGKLGGSTLAGVSCGLSLRESSAIGILMNTRGLMELVILNIGRELGVITDAVFAMMVIMALVTTALTTPVLNLIYPDRLLRRERIGRAAKAPGTRAVLIPISLPRSGRPLVRLADLLAGPRDRDRRITALHLRRPVEHEAYRSAIDDEPTDPARLEAFEPLFNEARQSGVEVEAVSFVSREVGADITRVVEEQGIDLVLMGFHKPVIGSAMLGGTVARVLGATAADVAVLVDRGLHDVRRILVPYMGAGHDRYALELADAMARNAAQGPKAGGAAEITVLHVVPSHRRAGDPTLNAKGEVERVFHDPGASGGGPGVKVTFRVLGSDDPVSAVLDEAPRHDLVVIAVGEAWGLEPHAFAWRPEPLMRDCPTSMLIVRQGTPKAAVAPAATPADDVSPAAPLSPA